ncbi:MAG: hypothetical protein FWG40_00690 [Peptococcaceae bacterium]|nr:hypothetical protein [Peptococcaceae bacterium]
MIAIKKSNNADSRTMDGKPNKQVLLNESMQHIEDVRKGCKYFADKLIEIGERHDHTKIEGIDQFFADYATGVTGAGFKAMKWFQLHMTERHHLNDRCPDDVTLLDVLERVIDITMAGMGRSGSVYDDTLDAGILQRAYTNTVRMLKEEIEVV